MLESVSRIRAASSLASELTETGGLARVFAMLILLVAAYMLWRSASALLA